MKTYINDLYETILGVSVLLISLVGSIVIANIITNMFNYNESSSIHLLLLLLHLVIIVYFVRMIRNMLTTIITNTYILQSVLNLTGPIIGATSLFLSPTIKMFTGYYSYHKLIFSKQ